MRSKQATREECLENCDTYKALTRQLNLSMKQFGESLWKTMTQPDKTFSMSPVRISWGIINLGKEKKGRRVRRLTEGMWVALWKWRTKQKKD